MIQREAGDGTYLAYEEEGFEPRATAEPGRYCSMVSQSTIKTCKRKSAWWVSYFTSYGPAAKTACDQHLAAAIRFVNRRDGDGATSMPKVFGIEG